MYQVLAVHQPPGVILNPHTDGAYKSSQKELDNSFYKASDICYKLANLLRQIRSHENL